MSNPKFGFIDAATVQRHVRTAMQAGRLNISQIFEICHSVFARAPRQTCGHHVNNKNELVPIRGAITGYDSDGKPVIARPIPEKQEPKRKHLRAVSIDSLVEADGRVDLAEAHEDDPQELSVVPVEQIRVAGEDTGDDDVEEEMGLTPDAVNAAALDDAALDDAALDEDADENN
jgi:hypothetical protein